MGTEFDDVSTQFVPCYDIFTTRVKNGHLWLRSRLFGLVCRLFRRSGLFVFMAGARSCPPWKFLQFLECLLKNHMNTVNGYSNFQVHKILWTLTDDCWANLIVKLSIETTKDGTIGSFAWSWKRKRCHCACTTIGCVLGWDWHSLRCPTVPHNFCCGCCHIAGDVPIGRHIIYRSTYIGEKVESKKCQTLQKGAVKLDNGIQLTLVGVCSLTPNAMMQTKETDLV